MPLFFIFFYTLCMKKPEHKAKAGAETCDVTNAFIILVRVEKKLMRSLMHAENCMYAQANKAVAIRWFQPQPPQKVATSGWKLLSFPCAYKANLTKFLPTR